MADVRFGYKGLIYGANEVAGIYILGIAFFYREVFRHKQPKKMLLFVTCVAAVLTGTKATLIGLILITLYYFAKYKARHLIVVLIPLVILTTSLVVQNWELINEKYLASNTERFLSNDLITFLMSGRDIYIVQNFTFINNHWSLINFLFGDSFLYSETDALDLYFFFGLVGALYLYMYTRLFFIRDHSIDNIFVFLVLIAIAAVSGHIIQSGVVPVFVLLYIFSEKGSRQYEMPRSNSFN